MLSYKNNENINIFSFIEQKSYNHKKNNKKKKKNIIYTSKQILTPLKKFIFPIKQDISRFVDVNQKFRKAQSEIISKIRITTITDPFDSITFQRDLLENIDQILDLFMTISEQKLFTLPEKKSIFIEEYQNLPIWFKKRGFNSIACWLVAHFENRIVYSYYKYDEDDNFLDKTSLDLVDNFICIWEKIERVRKVKIIEDMVRDYCGKVDGICFVENCRSIEESGVRDGFQNLMDNEKVFKLFLMNCSLRDLDLKSVVEIVTEKLLKLLGSLNDKEFVENAIYISLEEVFQVDAFFLSLLVMKLDQLRYQDFLKSDIEILDSKKKNKKRKRKNKNKKHVFSSFQENNSVTIDEKSDTVASLPNNKFDIKDKKEIIIEGKKILKISLIKIENNNNDNQCKSQKSFKKNSIVQYSSVNENSSFKEIKGFSDNNEKIKMPVEKYDKIFFNRRNSDIIGKKFNEKTNLSEYDVKDTKYKGKNKNIKSEIKNKKKIDNKSIKSEISNKNIIEKNKNIIFGVNNNTNKKKNIKSQKKKKNKKKKTSIKSDTKNQNFDYTKSIKSEIKNPNFDNEKMSLKSEKKKNFEINNCKSEIKKNIQNINKSIKSEKNKNFDNNKSIKSESFFKKKNSDKNIEIKSTSNKNLKNTKATSVKTQKNKTPDQKKIKTEKKISLQQIEKKKREPTPKKLLDEYFSNPNPKLLQQKSLHNQNVFSFQANRRTNSAFKKKIGSNSTVFYQIKTDEYLLSNSITNTVSSNARGRVYNNVNQNQKNNMNIPFDLKELEKKNLEREGDLIIKNEDGKQNFVLRNKSSEQEKRNKFKDDLLYKKKQKIKKKKNKKKKKKNVPKIINVIKWSDKEEQNAFDTDWVFDKVKKLEFPRNEIVKKNSNTDNNNNNSKKSKKIEEENIQYVKKKQDLQNVEKDLENLELNIDTKKKEIKKNKNKKKKTNNNKSKKKINNNSVKTNLSSKTNKDKTSKKTIFFEKLSYWKDEEEQLNSIFKYESPKKKEKHNYYTKFENNNKDSKNEIYSNLEKALENSFNDKHKIKNNDKHKIKNKNNSKNKRRKLTLTVSSPHTASSKRRNTVGEEQKYKKPVQNNYKVEKRLFEPIRKLSEEEKDNLKKYLNTSYNNILNSLLTKFIEKIEENSKKLSNPRKIFLNNLNKILKKTFKNNNITIKPYGSYSTNLLTPFSDMDLSIQNCKYIGKEKAVEMLTTLETNLKQCKFIKKTTSIFHAAVPVLKLEVDTSLKFQDFEISEQSVNLEIDIVVDLVEESNNISTSFRTTEYMNYCIKEYPSFYKNILFMKYLLSKKNMSNSYKGGLNAYGLGLLYVAFLDHYKKKKETHFFECLISFLDFLCDKFDPNLYAVYLNGNSTPFVSKQMFEFSYLVIFDPTSYVWKNVTPNGILFPKIVYYFRMVLKEYFDVREKLFFQFKDYIGNVDPDVIKEKVDRFFEKEKLEDLFYRLFFVKIESFLEKDDK